MQVKENTPKAIILIIIGMSAVAFQDTLIKYISSETNIFLILLFRALLGIIFLSIFLKIKKKPLIFKTNYPILTIIRVLLFYSAFVLYFFSLTKLSPSVVIKLQSRPSIEVPDINPMTLYFFRIDIYRLLISIIYYAS